jgi:hypothetical protein
MIILGCNCGCSGVPCASPQGFGHAVGGVLAERGRDVRVALGLAQLRVAEDLLDDADAGGFRDVPGEVVPLVSFERWKVATPSASS